ncbi:MAG: alpha/beta fold hydrolase [Desulfohalobiaceae bacterium]
MLGYSTMTSKRNQEWLLLLHGLGGSSNIWYKQLPVLSQNYNLLLPDFFGHGLTQEVRPEYSFQGLADELVKLLDHLQLKQVHVLGISLGSIVACTLALRHRPRVRSMLLGASVQNMNPQTRFLLQTARGLKHFLPYMWLYRFFAWIIMPGPNQKQSRAIFAREAGNLGRTEFKKWHTLLLQFPKLCRDFQDQEICRVPKLFISGERDHLFLRHVHEHISKDPKAALHVIPDCGHVCNIQAPQEFNRVCLQYLQGKYAVAQQQEPAWVQEPALEPTANR